MKRLPARQFAIRAADGTFAPTLWTIKHAETRDEATDYLRAVVRRSIERGTNFTPKVQRALKAGFEIVDAPEHPDYAQLTAPVPFFNW